MEGSKNMAGRLYKLINTETGEETIGTSKELSEEFDIHSDTFEDMVRYGYSLKGYTCERYIKEKKDFDMMGTSTNSELDRLAKEARDHGMSYGQYVGLTETKWRDKERKYV